MKAMKLGDIASIQTGKIDVNKAVPGGKYPFFTCSKDTYEIDEAPFEGKAVLVAGNGDLNVKYYEGKFNAYQRTYFLFVNDEEVAFPKYLYYFLESYVGQLRAESIGSTIKYIKMGNLTDAKIPLPSLPEQKAIVEKLDAAFAEIDTLESNLDTKSRYTNELLNSILGSTFSGDDADPKPHQGVDMKNVKLGQVAEVIAGQSPEGVFYNSVGNGIPFYQGKKEFGTKYLGKPTTWTTKVTKLARQGDILMSVRAPVGPINFSTYEICIGRGLAAIRGNKEIDNDFLFYFLLFKQPDLVGNAGAVFDSINKDQIAGIELLLPSLPEQKAIVEKLDAVFAEIDKLRERTKQAKESFSALRQSILSSVFTEKSDAA
jgi:type I restriction enzyme S subunit